VETVAVALWQAEQQAREAEPAMRHNLPRASYAQFIPRADEAGRDYVERIIQALVAGRAWLVAVDGPGGAGKTTLAYEAARRAVERRLFDAVVWTSAKPVELAPGATLARPAPARADSLEAILNTVAVVLGQRGVLALPTLDEKLVTINRLLAGTATLLVLDNLESLPGTEQARLFAWLRELPVPTRALLTSRERYAIGEAVIPLFGMTAREAVAFLQAEAQARGVPLPAAGELRRVAEATHGVPLAMQFVVGTMARYGFSVEQVLGPAATLRAPHLHGYLFEAAYQQLAAETRDLLHTLTLFPAPATAEAIAAAAGQGEIAATLGLGELFRSFFVNRTEDGRYSLVALVYDFLETREVSSPERRTRLVAARRRLARFYAAALGAEQLIGLRLRLAMPERENIEATLAWAAGAGEWQLLADLVEAVGDVYGILGFWQERVTWGRQAMRACELLGDYARAGWFAVKEVGWNLHRLGDPDGADIIADYLQQARRQEGDGWRRVEGLALRNLGRLARDRGDLDRAEALLERSLEVWEHIEEEGCLAFTRASLGLLQIQQGSLAAAPAPYYANAEANLRAALAARQAMGDTGKVAEGLAELGKVLAVQGRLGEGLRLVEEARDLAWQLPAPSPVYAYILHLRAEIEADILGNRSRARELAAESRAIFEQLGARYAVGQAERTLERLGV
ncbi:MAG TPA: NB-ARC domain-containing protein, partial [Ardenticatenaceae bacterium]|nr:NB-ARC domain-containing protein [Ardenticatenaceae bacterium]